MKSKNEINKLKNEVKSLRAGLILAFIFLIVVFILVTIGSYMDIKQALLISKIVNVIVGCS